MTPAPRLHGAALLSCVSVLLATSGCSSTAPTVTVTVGVQTEELSPTQYCLDGEPDFAAEQRPPVLRVDPDEPIRIDVPDEVAETGWAVQVFDDDLTQQIGRVDAGNATTFDTISTSDARPASYFLVIVQNAGSDCEGLSGAWPIGFVRG